MRNIGVEVKVLIETYWNVNLTLKARKRKTNGSLNRNILECKFTVHPGSDVEAYSLNRNILECKLIDQRLFDCRKNSLNRNILECKCGCNLMCRSRSNRLNRNILECKLYLVYSLPLYVTCLNRNILECKCGCRWLAHNQFPVLIETYWNVNTDRGLGFQTV